MIYFDNSATTMPDESVMETFLKAGTRYFANPSSLHTPGMEAERLIEKARAQIAGLIGAAQDEIIFTSGGTESNNLAIKGTAAFYKGRGRHIITTSIEHPSVYEACRDLEKEGFSITFVNPDKNGVVQKTDIEKSLTKETILVSVMHVNNETGALQPIKEISEMLLNHRAVFHVDNVQGFGKVPLSLNNTSIDLLSVSGHKLHGLNGTGFLYKRTGVNVAPLLSGGGQENGLRSGTENAAGIASLARAVRLLQNDNPDELRCITQFIREQLESRKWAVIHTPIQAAPHILNFSALGLKGEVLVHALEQEGIVVSTTSACSSKQNKPSRTLAAMNVSSEQAASAIRVSLSRYNTIEEAKQFIDALDRVIPVLAKKRNERT
ncbi:cysteine desulfurase family protein [Domibacillus epiphyticus]|uniref:Cysteine desulfurase NifS n=1 Tax=Domibacillus epiphyticus TaxID=1714355 RepID=A0A1V2A913_9BACI|nr:cysteine desulfurase family protein [Domibacillus epiphyticus]OMP67447.1 cysteine desulfurase NifS [Domibacillus epiphyticus]